MKMNKFLLFTLLIIGVMCINVEAVDLIGTDGAANDSGIYAIQHTDDRVMTVAIDAGIKYSYEAATTSDTLTAAETGKIIAVNCATACEFELPAAVGGLNYTFVSTNNDAVFSIDPNGTELIQWSNGAAPLDAGDKITSPGNTGDSLTLFSTAAGFWSVIAETGTWTDGGA